MLFLSVVVASLTVTTFASDALLSPRARGNQIRVVAPAPGSGITITYVKSLTPVSPRVQAAQLKVLKGLIVSTNPALECRNNMKGSPRAVTACSQSVTMPSCAKATPAKMLAEAKR